MLSQPDAAEQFARLQLGLASTHLALLDRTACHVPQHRLPREQRALLEHDHAIGAGKQALAGRREQVVVEMNFAGGELVETGDRVEQRRLAATGRTDHDTELPRHGLERHIVERHHPLAFRIVGLSGMLGSGAHRRVRMWLRSPSYARQSICERHRMSLLPTMRTIALET